MSFYDWLAVIGIYIVGTAIACLIVGLVSNSTIYERHYFVIAMSWPLIALLVIVMISMVCGMFLVGSITGRGGKRV